MKISGFSIARNIRKYNYPILEAIRAILPICDEFVINVGESDDDTFTFIQSLKDPKIRIIQTKWNLDQKPDILSHATNLALKECKSDWAFYVQADELIHEDDLPRLKGLMEKHLHDDKVDAFRFKWLHFFGSYHRYRIDHGWFQKQERIIRNNGTIESCTDAWTFRRKDGQPLRIKHSGCFLYHYGWVHPGDVMTQRRLNAETLWKKEVPQGERKGVFSYGDLNRFPPYFGSHPAVMRPHLKNHTLSRQDWQDIERRYWWHPMKVFKVRYKTFKRVKTAI